MRLTLVLSMAALLCACPRSIEPQATNAPDAKSGEAAKLERCKAAFAHFESIGEREAPDRAPPPAALEGIRKGFFEECARLEDLEIACVMDKKDSEGLETCRAVMRAIFTAGKRVMESMTEGALEGAGSKTKDGEPK